MNVKEIKAKSPETDVYEFNPNARYLIVVQKTSETGEKELQEGDVMIELLEAMQVRAVALIAPNLDDVKFFEFIPRSEYDKMMADAHERVMTIIDEDGSCVR